MSVIKTTPEKLGATLKAQVGRNSKAILKGVLQGALRGQKHMKENTPTDEGMMRNAWKVTRLLNAIHLDNSAPYAGVMERGARPHPVSREGIEAIAGWVKRHRLADTPKGCMQIAYAIANRIREKGYKGTQFVANNLEKLNEFLRTEVERTLKKSIDGNQ